MKSLLVAVCLLGSCLAQNLCACVTVDNPSNPSGALNPFTYFNVYSLNDIGSSGSSYHSDIQGTTGAAGNVHFSNFSLEPVGLCPAHRRQRDPDGFLSRLSGHRGKPRDGRHQH